jgi:hypothetical protein
MKRLSAALAIVAAAIALVGVNSASAATVFGSNCAANRAAEGEAAGAVWVSTAHPGIPLSATAPISGVISEWTVNSDLKVVSEGKLAGEFPRMYQQRLLVLHAEGEFFKVVGEAPGGPLNLIGASTYLTRLPVQQGDFLGIAGNPFTLFCQTGSAADSFVDTVGGTPVGSSFKPLDSKVGLQVPVVARVEPDVDGDGYGDETQDQCPQSAAYQTACPVVTVSSLSLAHPKAVTVYVSSSLAAPIAVSAKVKVGKGKTATLKARAQTVAPGALGHFNLVLTKKVLNTLKALTTKKSLTLKISASATNVTGLPSTAKSKLKLRGQKKPFHHRTARGKKPQNPAKSTAPKHKHQ